jgi:uncharacterized repeat protein (TIGR03803 family)
VAKRSLPFNPGFPGSNGYRQKAFKKTRKSLAIFLRNDKILKTGETGVGNARRSTNLKADSIMKKPAERLLITLTLMAGIPLAGAQTLILLYSFTDGNDGDNPIAGLIQANDGNLYGTTYEGGTNGDGTIFRIATSGTLTPVYSFTGAYDGAHPYSGLIQANDGNLYGTTEDGGTNGDGVVFRITTNNFLMPLYSFTGGHDGDSPRGWLVQASDGNLYGTATGGGTNFDGTVFRITTNGTFLMILSYANQSTLSWPGWAANYILQSTTNLASLNWVTLSNVVPTLGNSVTATLTNSLPAQYFRLAKP